jgi:hypothetical protein
MKALQLIFLVKEAAALVELIIDRFIISHPIITALVQKEQRKEVDLYSTIFSGHPS